MNIKTAQLNLAVAKKDVSVGFASANAIERYGNWFQKTLFKKYNELIQFIDKQAMKRCFDALDVPVMDGCVDIPEVGNLDINTIGAREYAARLINQHSDSTSV
jgi:hypothetical protein